LGNQLHIVAFDIPFPANYGGVIDVFYRLKALQEQGIEITLHCFEYGDRLRRVELEKYCKQVYYYSRKKYFFQFWMPYIVSSRSDSMLLNNLCLNQAPILFEALHSCYFLDHPKLKKRIKLVRMHNIEHDYYALLAKAEKQLLKKAYYLFESAFLKRYEGVLSHANYILAISPKDQKNLTDRFKEKVMLLPAFHGNETFSFKEGKGDFCFYHGKLSVAENHLAALYLINEIFSKTSISFKIAGDGASNELKKAVARNKNIELLEGLNPEEINTLIQNAQINVLYTFQPTGIKLKLVNVLYQGRFILVNNPMVSETNLENACRVEDNPQLAIKAVEEIMNKGFSTTDGDERRKIVGEQFDNKKNALKICKLIS
jgi:hypothetical protein